MSHPHHPTLLHNRLPYFNRGLVRNGLVAEYRYTDATGQVLKDWSGQGNHGELGSTSGADTNDPTWTTAGASYDGVDDYVTGAPAATEIQTLMGDGTIAAGMVRGKRQNVKATVYYEGRWSRDLTQAEKNNNLAYLKGVVLRRGFTGTVYDWAYPIPCNAGTMDFTITNGQGILWVFPDGTTSTSAHPAKVLASAGTCWLYLTNWGASNLQITDANTNTLYTGSLADLPPLTYYLSLYGCSLVTGDLTDLPPLTYYLNLSGCSLVTGDLTDLPPLTNTLSLSGCSLVTGSLADLPPLTNTLNLTNCSSVTGSLTDLPPLTYYLSLSDCSLVTGVLSPHTSLKTVNLSGTGLSTANMDQTIINLATNNTQTNGTLTTNGTRSAASDAAVATLRARGWTVDGS
jgi:hypothetical protein